MADIQTQPTITKDNAPALESDITSAASAQRAAGLASAKVMETIKNNALVKEVKRLSAKYGAGDARVQTMNTRIAYSPSITAAIDVETARLSVPVPSSTAGGWLVEGIVYDANGKPMTGVTVFLTEDGKTAVPDLPWSCTPATGAYSIALTSAYVDKWKGNQNIALAVSDANKQVIFADNTRLGAQINADAVYIHNLLTGSACTPPPGTR
jgi:hypothetical protein